MAYQSDNKIYDKEGNLAYKEVVVYSTAKENREGKYASSFVVHIFIKCPQHYGEEYYCLVEMVEENVINREAAEGIQQTADHCR